MKYNNSESAKLQAAKKGLEKAAINYAIQILTEYGNLALAEDELDDEPDDFDPNDEEHGHKRRKENTFMLADAYDVLGQARKADRVRDCNTILKFDHTGGEHKLVYRNGCKVRLCPTCMWSLSRKNAYLISRYMNIIKRNHEKTGFALLTLTQGRVKPEDLKDEVSRVLKAWTSMTKKRYFNREVHGYCRSLEITHDVQPKITSEMYAWRKQYYIKQGLNIGDDNPFYDTYHTHLHIMLHMDNRRIIRLRTTEYRLMEVNDWRRLWGDALKLNYVPVVDIREFKPEKGHGTYELAKYIVKPDDYIFANDEKMAETVGVLDNATYERTLLAYAGTFREARNQFADDDEILDDTLPLKDESVNITTWCWNTGYSQYNRVYDI